MGMQNFSSEFETPEQYIIDITYKIWEEQGVGRIRDWYSAHCPVRSPHGVSNTSEAVVSQTLSSQQIFPNRDLLAEDIIIGDKPSGFYSSHRVRSVGKHMGNGYLGPATQRPVTMLAIADCLCRDNRIVEEWVLGDQAAAVIQLGLDPVAYGEALGATQSRRLRHWQRGDAPAVGRPRWTDHRGGYIHRQSHPGYLRRDVERQEPRRHAGGVRPRRAL